MDVEYVGSYDVKPIILMHLCSRAFYDFYNGRTTQCAAHSPFGSEMQEEEKYLLRHCFGIYMRARAH